MTRNNIFDKNMWCCYILKSKVNGRRYIGVTNDVERRLRQHNGEIKGGAKSTRAGRPYEIYYIVGGFETYSDALKYEYKLKNNKDFYNNLLSSIDVEKNIS
jgi:predicted GIY-YIG superfamily endonuclease